MELRQLKYFVVVAEELNFTRAAARLHIAQPSLSVQIHNLQAEVGAALLQREGQHMKLTAAGRIFLEQTRQILSQINRSVTLARQTAGGEIGHLSIGYNTPAEFRVFPTIVPAFKKQCPNIHLTFHNLNIAQQLEALRRDELDVGFVWLPIPAEHFDVQELTKEPFVAVLPSNHRLASKAVVSIRDLSQEPLILPNRSMDAPTFNQIEQLFVRAGAEINVVYEVETLLSAINFVAMGNACSILADYSRRVREEGVVYKPLRPAGVAKTLAMVKKKGRGDLAERFFRFTAQNLPAQDAQ